MSGRISPLSCSKLGSIALLLACSACPGDDIPSTTNGDSETDTNGVTTTGVTTVEPDSTSQADSTTVEPTTAEPTTTDATTAEPTTTTTDATTTDTTTMGGPVCGDGVADAGEECDGDDLGAEDCVSQGFEGGTLLCNKDCTLDTGMCTSIACGDDVAEGTEECDGTDLAGQSCQTQGFSMGTLACAGDCTFDTSGCSNPMCGNDVTEMGEVCDGTDLGGQTCVTLGLPGGTLGCLDDCSAYDTTGCSCAETDVGGAMGAAVASGDTSLDDDDIAAGCGGASGPDHIVQFTAPFAGDFVFDTFGSSYDTKIALYSDCATEISCNDDFGGTLQSGLQLNMAAGQTVLIVVDGFNGGSGSWVLNIHQPAVCGDGTADAPEQCDGADLNGQDCTTQGFTAGSLACAGDCASLDSSGCFNGPACADEDIGSVTGAAVAAGNNAGDDSDITASCTGAGGPDHVMQWTAPAAGNYTFDTFGSGYDTTLSLFSDCATESACNDDSGGTQSQVALNVVAGQQVLIVVDGWNGATGDWVLNITAPAGGFVCEDANLGSVIGNAVAAGSTAGSDNDLNPSCGAGDALDQVFRWTAPAAASYTFTTAGSNYDTVLSLWSDCATQLVCNDDSGGTLQSSVQRNMVAGEVVLILVDGYNGGTGNYTLNIASP